MAQPGPNSNHVLQRPDSSSTERPDGRCDIAQATPHRAGIIPCARRCKDPRLLRSCASLALRELIAARAQLNKGRSKLAGTTCAVPSIGRFHFALVIWSRRARAKPCRLTALHLVRVVANARSGNRRTISGAANGDGRAFIRRTLVLAVSARDRLVRPCAAGPRTRAQCDTITTDPHSNNA